MKMKKQTINYSKIQLKDEDIILEKTNLLFENHSVLNPGCIKTGDIVHMFYRAVHQDDLSSTIGYCQLSENRVIKRLNHPILVPEHQYEKSGLEDPRIVLIDNTYYLLYAVFDGKTALTAYAISKQLPHFKKQGLLFPKIPFQEAKNILKNTRCGQKYLEFKTRYLEAVLDDNDLIWMKNVLLFPKKINGKYALIYRIVPGMHIIYFDDFDELTDDYWKTNLADIDNHVLFYPKFDFETHHISGGCPPIETKEGWLFIYHALESSSTQRRFHACVALLDLKNPQKVLGRLKYPLFSPKAKWEKFGFVNNVVFPSGAVVSDGKLYIYYGAADELIAAKSVDLNQLLDELKG